MEKEEKQQFQFCPETREATSRSWALSIFLREAAVLSGEYRKIHKKEYYIGDSMYVFIAVETTVLIIVPAFHRLRDDRCLAGAHKQLESRLEHLGSMYTTLCKVSYAHTSDSSDSHWDKLFCQCNCTKPKVVSNCIYHCNLFSKFYSLQVLILMSQSCSV